MAEGYTVGEAECLKMPCRFDLRMVSEYIVKARYESNHRWVGLQVCFPLVQLILRIALSPQGLLILSSET